MTRMKRMTARSELKPYIIYPESFLKQYWDVLVSLMLIFTCIMTPLWIVFNPNNKFLTVTMRGIDIFFFFDMVAIFNSAYIDEDFETHD